MSAPCESHLLVVDDEAEQVAALCETLTAQNFRVEGCNSGEEALDALHRRHFDLMLSDLAMPGMNGIQLMQAALRRDPALAVVMMSNDGTISAAVEAMRCGAADVVTKPFRLPTVLAALERGLALRTLRKENALLERQLRENATRLAAANEELEAFTRSASHDLRSPLNAVLGYSTLLLHTAGATLPPEQRRMVVNTERAARRMDELIASLVRFARFGSEALDIRPVDLVRLVRSVLVDMRQDEASTLPEIRLGELPTIAADETQIRRVFCNLLSNAIKFSARSPSPLVEVDCLEKAEESPVIRVRDNGIGFEMQRAAQLFEPFHRLHRSGDYEGSGLGLSIVQRVVRTHGGRVWAESAPGRGASFFFTLPRHGRASAAPRDACENHGFEDKPRTPSPWTSNTSIPSDPPWPT